MDNISQADQNKIINRAEVFKLIEKITGVPFMALIALWGAFDEFKLKPADRAKGFFGLPLVMPKEELSLKLFTFNRLTLDEVKVLLKKGPTNMICASLLIAHDLKANSKRVLYPEQSEQVVLESLRSFKPESVHIYRQIKELNLCPPKQ